MNDRERSLAVLRYEDYDRMPLVHFGFWPETLLKWVREGHIPMDTAVAARLGNAAESEVAWALGFDFDWDTDLEVDVGLRPPFEEALVEERPDGSQAVRNADGVVVLRHEGAASIPAEIDHLLTDRASWEEHYRPRLRYSDERVLGALVDTGEGRPLRVDAGGDAVLREGAWERPYGLFCGSLYGRPRNWWGLVGISLLQAEDPKLFDEVIETQGQLCYRVVERALRVADTFDFGHFWEDISGVNGPLVNPKVLAEKAGPHYQRITELLLSHGIDLVSLDSDGDVSELIPVWLDAGVNIMFPIEVGTWHSSIAPWRASYGKQLLGVGGMDKRVFAQDRYAIDAEIERLKPLVDLGGYIPCPDHLIAPDAEWANVQYYCERMRRAFGG